MNIDHNSISARPLFITQDNYPEVKRIEFWGWSLQPFIVNHTVAVWRIKYK